MRVTLLGVQWDSRRGAGNQTPAFLFWNTGVCDLLAILQLNIETRYKHLLGALYFSPK